MLQYGAQLLLPDVAKLIDDLHYQNFHIPALKCQQRLVKNDENGLRLHANVESDYVDAQEQFTYQSPAFPLRENIDSDQYQRLETAVALLKTALKGKPISAEKLIRALTELEFAEYKNSIVEVAERSEIMFGEGVPTQLKSYNLKLNAADLMWTRFEAKDTNSVINAKRRFRIGEFERRSESLYELALEYLEETFGCAERGDWGAEMLSRLQHWMDRPIDFSAGVNRMLGPDAHSVPRVRGSKSKYAHDSGLPKLSKRIKQKWCALIALEKAVTEIVYVVHHPQPVELTPEQKLQLKSKLAKLKNTLD